MLIGVQTNWVQTNVCIAWGSDELGSVNGHSMLIQGLSKIYAKLIQLLFKAYSKPIQGLFKGYPRLFKVHPRLIQDPPKDHSMLIQGLFKAIQGYSMLIQEKALLIQGLFKATRDSLPRQFDLGRKQHKNANLHVACLPV